MARKPNYRFARLERERNKAARKAERAKQKAERAEQRRLEKAGLSAEGDDAAGAESGAAESTPPAPGESLDADSAGPSQAER